MKWYVAGHCSRPASSDSEVKTHIYVKYTTKAQDRIFPISYAFCVPPTIHLLGPDMLHMCAGGLFWLLYLTATKQKAIGKFTLLAHSFGLHADVCKESVTLGRSAEKWPYPIYKSHLLEIGGWYRNQNVLFDELTSTFWLFSNCYTLIQYCMSVQTNWSQNVWSKTILPQRTNEIPSNQLTRPQDESDANNLIIRPYCQVIITSHAVLKHLDQSTNCVYLVFPTEKNIMCKRSGTQIVIC